MLRKINAAFAMLAFGCLVSCDTGYDPMFNRTIYSIKTTTGTMPQNETWSGELLLTGDVTIPYGVRLTIRPGTIIRFKARQDDQHWKGLYEPEDPSTYHAVMTCILIEGSLDAQGTEEKPILFTTDRAVPDTLDWHGLIINSDGQVTLEHVTLEHSYCGIQLLSKSGRARIENSILRDITNCGIYTLNDKLYGPIVIEGSQFIRAGKTGLNSYAEQNISVRGNVFAENPMGILTRSSIMVVENNTFVANGCAIAVAGGAAPEVAYNLFSQHSIAAILISDAVPLLTQNNFDTNVLHVKMTGSMDVEAADNWWGTTDTAEIDRLIEDNQDSPELGLFNYQPFALQAYILDIPDYSLTKSSFFAELDVFKINRPL